MGEEHFDPNGHSKMSAQDHETFHTWYEAYRTRLRAWCVALLGDEVAAEDVAQEALARAWARRDLLRDQKEIGAWLFRVARNLCIDHVRARRRVIPVQDVPETAQDTTDPEHPLELEEERRAVRAALAGLNRRHRELLYLHHVDGVGYEELAERIGVSNQGARSALFRARQGLRERLRAVSGGAYAAFVWVRVRARETARRATGRLEWIEPAAASVAQAGLALAVASTMTVGGAAALAAAPLDGAYATGARAGALAAAQVEPERAGALESARASAPRDDEGDGSRSPVHAHVDPGDGDFNAGASVPGSDGEDPPIYEDLIVDVDPEGDPVVTAALETADEACETSGACQKLNETEG